MKWMPEKVQRSLSAQLMVMFSAACLGILISVVSLLWYLEEKHFEEEIVPKIVYHINLAMDYIGSPPDYQRAQRYGDSLGANLYIVYDGMLWASNGDLSIPEKFMNAEFEYPLDRVEHPFIPPELQLGETDKGDHFLRWKTQHKTVYMDVPDDDFKIPGLGLGLSISGTVVALILLLYYLKTQQLFAPIQKVRDGISRYTQGELDEPIQLDRQDELGELANQIDHMAEEIKDMLQAKRQLLLAISHELRTPVTRAHISAAMLEESPLKQDIQNDLREMEKLVSDLLEGERLNDQHRALNLSVVSINDLLTEVKGYFTHLDISLDQLDEDLFIEVDPVRIQLLLRNLLNNASKYSPDNSSSIALSAQLKTHSLLIKVQDQGEGIAAEHLEKLTEPFYRADHSRQRQSGGYGLGLYLCRLIAEAHNGTLQIDSTLGQGTSVTLILPLPKAS